MVFNIDVTTVTRYGGSGSQFDGGFVVFKNCSRGELGVAEVRSELSVENHVLSTAREGFILSLTGAKGDTFFAGRVGEEGCGVSADADDECSVAGAVGVASVGGIGGSGEQNS